MTRLAAVVGWPVTHSRSPAIHNAGFEAIGFDAEYVTMPVAPDEGVGVPATMRERDMLGISVTMPHKDAVMAGCDRATEAAAALGAANCLFWHEAALWADNTDGQGFVRGLAYELDVDPNGMRCAVVGAGGAARAVVRALADAGASHVVVVNRSPERAEAAAAHAGERGVVGSSGDIASCDLVVNATPIGMADTDQAGGVPFDPELLSDHAVVSDLIYHPTETPLLAAAASAGLRHQNGLAMLVHQAAVQFEHWTNHDAPIAAMTAAVADSPTS